MSAPTYDGWSEKEIQDAQDNGESIPIGVWEQWLNRESDSDLEEE
jgi:hypothetical protein